MATEKKETRESIRLTAEDQKIIAALKKKLGLNFTSVVRQSVRALAEQQGLKQ